MSVDGMDAEKEIEELLSFELHNALDVDQYAKLMALLIVNNELCEAKMVWMRAPEEQKGPDTILFRLREVWKCRWEGEDVGLFNALGSDDWPEDIAPLMHALFLTKKGENLELISNGYSSMKLEQVAKQLGVTEEVAIEICNELDWVYEPDTGFVCPKAIPDDDSDSVSDENQLSQFTESISFLEK